MIFGPLDPNNRTLSIFGAKVCNRCILSTHIITAKEKELLRWAVEELSVEQVTPRPVIDVAALTAPDITHSWILGRSGYGKTTLVKQLLKYRFGTGDGCGFIDPHGDAADDLLGHVPESRLDDVIYFAPASPACPSLNLLALPYRKDKLTDDIVSLFKLFFSDSWGVRLEMLLKQGLLTLLADSEPHSLADLQRLYSRPEYRDTITDRCPHEGLRYWWENEFLALPKDAPQSLLNKLYAFLGPFSPLERVLSSPKNDIDFPAIMDGRKIFLANLSKGQLGQETSALLGGMLMTAFSQAALARADQPEHRRIPFHLVADEFQTYLVHSFATILEEARKYGLRLTLANQTLHQVGALDASLFGNVSAIVAFQVDAQDASKLKARMRTYRQLPRTDELKAHITETRALARYGLKRLITNPAARGSNETVDSIPYRLAGGRKLTAQGDDAIRQELLGLPTAPVVLSHLASLRQGDINLCRYDAETPISDGGEWPEGEDFQSLPKLRAIVRLHEYKNVHELVTEYLPPPNDEVRRRLLEAARAQFTARPAQPAQSTTKRPSAPTVDDEFC